MNYSKCKNEKYSPNKRRLTKCISRPSMAPSSIYYLSVGDSFEEKFKPFTL